MWFIAGLILGLWIKSMRLALGDRYRPGQIRFWLGRQVIHHIRWAFGIEWKHGFVGILVTRPNV